MTAGTGMRLQLAGSPNTWGADHADRPGVPPWAAVLNEMAQAGFKWMELGPLGYLPLEPGRAAAEAQARGMGVVGSFMLEPVHDPQRRAQVIQGARRAAEFIADAGGHLLVMVDWGSPERGATAGRSDEAPRMGPRAWAGYLETYMEVARLAREDYGLLALVHPHAGTGVEFEDEVERAMDGSDLAMCVDTGHLVYAGMDPSAVYDRFADRVPHLNFKDVAGPVLDSSVAQSLGFLEAVDAGIFCALGEGLVDFGSMRDSLERHGYKGVATIEQDRDPLRAEGSALADMRRSLAFLRSAGLG